MPKIQDNLTTIKNEADKSNIYSQNINEIENNLSQKPQKKEIQIDSLKVISNQEKIKTIKPENKIILKSSESNKIQNQKFDSITENKSDLDQNYLTKKDLHVQSNQKIESSTLEKGNNQKSVFLKNIGQESSDQQKIQSQTNKFNIKENPNQEIIGNENKIITKEPCTNIENTKKEDQDNLKTPFKDSNPNFQTSQNSYFEDSPIRFKLINPKSGNIRLIPIKNPKPINSQILKQSILYTPKPNKNSERIRRRQKSRSKTKHSKKILKQESAIRKAKSEAIKRKWKGIERLLGWYGQRSGKAERLMNLTIAAETFFSKGMRDSLIKSLDIDFQEVISSSQKFLIKI